MVYKKLGKNLKGKDKHAFIDIILGVDTWAFLIKEGKDPLLNIYGRGISRANLDNLICSKCGSDYRVEMHHIRMLKDLNPKINIIDRKMAEKQRKQIPLCRSCHMEHHKRQSILK